MVGYRIERKNRFLDAVCSLVEHENCPGNTVTFSSLVDLTEVERLRAAARGAGEDRPSYTAILMKTVALALREHPCANRRVWRFPLLGRRLQSFEVIDATVLCERDLPGAPMVAFCDMFRNADRASLADINVWLRKLAKCTTADNRQWADFERLISRLPSWLSRLVLRLPTWFPRLWVKYRGGAFAISSPAKYGVDSVQATWPWPLGFSFGLVKDRPVGVGGEIRLRPTFHLTMNFDRRVMAGAQAARFFKRIVDTLEHAGSELAEAPAEAPPKARQEAVVKVDAEEELLAVSGAQSGGFSGQRKS